VFGIRVTATDLGVPMIASFSRNVESQKPKLTVLSFKDIGHQSIAFRNAVRIATVKMSKPFCRINTRAGCSGFGLARLRNLIG
jgi:hypothetical protein